MFQRILALLTRQTSLTRRSWHRLFSLFYWSTLDLFFWGVLTLYLNQIGRAEFNFVTVFLGALILWDFFTRAQQSISVSFLEDIWSRNLANIFATPIRMGEFLAGSIVISIVQTLIVMSFIALLAWLFLAFNLFMLGPLLLPFIAILFVFGWALGIFAMSVILRLGPSADILAWSIPVLIYPLSAVYYPVSALPAFLQPLSRVLPTTHVFEGMREVVLHGTFAWHSFFAALALGVLALTLSIALFALVVRVARRKGLLIRFSTE